MVGSSRSKSGLLKDRGTRVRLGSDELRLIAFDLNATQLTLEFLRIS